MVVFHWLAGLLLITSVAWIGLLSREPQTTLTCYTTPNQGLWIFFFAISIGNLTSVFILLKIMSSRFLKLFTSAKHRLTMVSV